MTWAEIVTLSGTIGYALSWCIHVGRRLVGTLKNVVPLAVLDLAIDKAREAADAYTDNATRRNSVLAHLERAGVSEHIARLAVELAVQVLKAETVTVAVAAHSAVNS